MRRAGEIRIVRGVEYEVLDIVRDLIGLVFSVGVIGLIVFRTGGWM